jgi:hypothetical protein
MAMRFTDLRVRSHCRFRKGKGGTESLSKSGIKLMIGSAKRQCDRALKWIGGGGTRERPSPGRDHGTCRAFTRLNVVSDGQTTEPSRTYDAQPSEHHPVYTSTLTSLTLSREDTGRCSSSTQGPGRT